MTDSEWLFSMKDVEASLRGNPAATNFIYAMQHGSMKFGLYAPVEADTQEPHLQDERYVVLVGSGSFIKNGVRRAVQPHDVIFVEAGAEHRFVDVSSDFSAWAMFWGPEGGERNVCEPSLPFRDPRRP